MKITFDPLGRVHSFYQGRKSKTRSLKYLANYNKHYWIVWERGRWFKFRLHLLWRANGSTKVIMITSLVSTGFIGLWCIERLDRR